MPSVQVELNFEPLVAVASMLYGASFVAERYSGLREFLESGASASEALACAKKRKLQGQQPPQITSVLSHSDDASDSEVRCLEAFGAGCPYCLEAFGAGCPYCLEAWRRVPLLPGSFWRRVPLLALPPSCSPPGCTAAHPTFDEGAPLSALVCRQGLCLRAFCSAPPACGSSALVVMDMSERGSPLRCLCVQVAAEGVGLGVRANGSSSSSLLAQRTMLVSLARCLCCRAAAAHSPRTHQHRHSIDRDVRGTVHAAASYRAGRPPASKSSLSACRGGERLGLGRVMSPQTSGRGQ